MYVSMCIDSYRDAYIYVYACLRIYVYWNTGSERADVLQKGNQRERKRVRVTEQSPHRHPR